MKYLFGARNSSTSIDWTTIEANSLVEESYLETCRAVGKTELFMQFEYCYWQAKKAQYRRLHIKRDRYSAGSKRGRRR